MKKHLAQKLVCTFSMKIYQRYKRKRKILKILKSQLFTGIYYSDIYLHLISCPAFTLFFPLNYSHVHLWCYCIGLVLFLTHINDITKCLNFCSDSEHFVNMENMVSLITLTNYANIKSTISLKLRTPVSQLQLVHDQYDKKNCCKFC